MNIYILSRILGQFLSICPPCTSKVNQLKINAFMNNARKCYYKNFFLKDWTCNGEK